MPYLPPGLPEPNYDESKVPVFELPSPLKKSDGTMVQSKEEWECSQREKVLSLLEQHMFGKIPPKPAKMEIIVSDEKEVFSGLGTRKNVRLVFSDKYAENLAFDLLVYIPAGASSASPCPCITGLNFGGNHSVEDDEDISMPDFYFPENIPARGIQHRRWIPEYMLKRGFALITGCYHQLFADEKEGTKNSIYRLFYPAETIEAATPGEYTAISAWSWGLIRIMDYITQCPCIDQNAVAVTGHSRLGKTALWAGANDTRFSTIISNNSGCGGAALTKREFGETLEIMNGIFPHWLTPQAKIDGKMPQEIDFDQNFLLSLAAPRALAVSSASEDIWADPKGEFLGLVGTNDVYKLYGVKEIPSSHVPGGGESLDNCIRHYHCRIGKHDILQYDWEKYLDFVLRTRDNA
jgi:hypothetical protein